MRIMVIEDNPADQMLVEEAVAHTDPTLILTFCDNGHDALTTLNTLLTHCPRELPNVILLDINLPGQTGFEVLEQLKATPGLRVIPVVMLTTSDLTEDVEKAYRRHASAFITKRPGYSSFQETFAAAVTFWKATVFPAVDQDLRL